MLTMMSNINMMNINNLTPVEFHTWQLCITWLTSLVEGYVDSRAASIRGNTVQCVCPVPCSSTCFLHVFPHMSVNCYSRTIETEQRRRISGQQLLAAYQFPTHCQEQSLFSPDSVLTIQLQEFVFSLAYPIL